MGLIVIGTNHKRTPVQIREKLSLTTKDKFKVLDKINRLSKVDEGVILSTCNRTELYLTGLDEKFLIDFALSVYRELSSLTDIKLKKHIYIYNETGAIEHLYRVASGLDSLVLCENQIMGQLKSAFKLSEEAGVIGGLLGRLFTEGFRVGKRVRNQSKASFRSTSIGQVAVQLAEELFGSLEGETVLILGAGETGELTLRALVDRGIKGVLVANRTYENGKRLADKFSGDLIKWEGLESRIEKVDIIIASTAAPHYLLGYDLVKKVMEKRVRPLFLIDIALPRDIEPRVKGIDGVYLYNIDHLKEIAEGNIAHRSQVVAKIEAIIKEELLAFKSWLYSQRAVPLIKSLRGSCEKVREEELDRLFKRMDSLEGSEKELIEQFSRRLVNKLLHRPTVGMKELSAQKQEGNLELLKKLFLE